MRPPTPAEKCGLSAGARQTGAVRRAARRVTRGGRLAGLYGPKSAFALISSASPPAPDVGGTPGEGLKLNIPLEFGRGNLKKVSGFFGQGLIL